MSSLTVSDLLVGPKKICELTSKAIDTEKLNLRVCECSTAAHQLLERGLFPCAPLSPTLAVDVHQLQFVAKYSVREKPNVSAWAAALTESLESEGFSLAERVGLHIMVVCYFG